jgi:uncharacterized membrane protein YidH (DUF202 family)
MKTTLTLQKQILARIKTQGVKPMSKGYFRMREYVLWGLLGVFVAALSVGFAMIIFMLKGTDLDLFNKLGLSFTEKILYTIPSFWIVATVVVATIALINFRNTRRGYRTSTRQFILISALISVGLGSVAYAFNVSEFVDKAASANIPLYNDVVPLNTNAWLDPAHGLLSGTVRSKNSNSDFFLRDAESVLWHVTGDTELPEGYTFSSGDRVRLIGKAGSGDTFEVTEIVPWE